MSLRLRLTLLYSGLLAMLLFLIVVITLTRVQANARATIDAELKRKGDQLVRIMESDIPSSPLANALLPTITSGFEPELYVLIWNGTQEITHRSANLGNRKVPLPEPFYRRAMAGEAGYYNLTARYKDDLRVYYVPIRFGEEVVAAAQIVRYAAPEQAILNELASNLFWIIAVALALGAGVGYWLAGVTLKPIQEATATALAITRTGRLDRRVQVASTRHDEIGTLVNTFNEMLDRLQELFQQQKRFTGDISHELRSPLTAIVGNVGLLKRGDRFPASEREEMLMEIEVEAQQMNRLISDLLLLAQADADPQVMRERVELDTLLLEVYRQAQRRSGDRIALRLVHEDQAVVLGDADRLRQMLVNLVNNAIQYTPDGGKVDLGLHCSGDQAEISIVDNGQGIDEEDLPHIFDRFYRADKARSRAVGGTGLGLSIVKWVVDAHDGEIDVESEPGVGTTFRVRLPLLDGCNDPVVRRSQKAT